MGMMILMIAIQISLNLTVSMVQYGLGAYVVAYMARKGWKAGK